MSEPDDGAEHKAARTRLEARDAVDAAHLDDETIAELCEGPPATSHPHVEVCTSCLARLMLARTLVNGDASTATTGRSGRADRLLKRLVAAIETAQPSTSVTPASSSFLTPMCEIKKKGTPKPT